MNIDDWTSKIDYGNGSIKLEIVHGAITELPLVHRKDKNEDGTISEYYYLELTKNQFEWLRAIKLLWG